MSKREKHEGVDVHARSVDEVGYFGATADHPREFISVRMAASSSAHHYRSFGQSEARLDCEGRATVYLDIPEAARLRDRLTEALTRAGALNGEPVAETVG
jgi:hypothetical protein